MTPFDFQPTTRVVFGPGTLDRLGELGQSLGGTKALVVSDAGIERAGHLGRGIQSLERAGIAVHVFTGVAENPTTEHVDAALAVANSEPIDLIVGIGGGSSMDTAKGVNFLLTNGGAMVDYWGVNKATKPMLPMVAVPTTAGTGSEAQSFALIADAKSHRKMACGDRKAACRIAILDPETTLSQPESVAAVSGLDALSHALETWVSKKATAISRLYSKAAWELLRTGLPTVFDHPADLDARGQVLLGAHFAGAAIENSMLGAAHAAANPLTARFQVTHGAAVAAMLPHVVEFNATHCEEIYRQLDAKCPSSNALATFVRSMLQAAKLPNRLADYGVRDRDIDSLASDAVKEWTGKFNPIEVLERDFVRLYRAAL